MIIYDYNARMRQERLIVIEKKFLNFKCQLVEISNGHWANLLITFTHFPFKAGTKIIIWLFWYIKYI